MLSKPRRSSVKAPEVGGFVFGPSLTSLSASAIPITKPPPRVALKPPLFPGKPRRPIDIKGLQIHYSDALSSSKREMRMCSPTRRQWDASRASSPSWNAHLGTSHNAGWRDSASPWRGPPPPSMFTASNSSFFGIEDTHEPQQQYRPITSHSSMKRPSLSRAKSSVEAFGQGLSALRAKSPPGQRLRSLRDDNLHKFIARPMYGGLYLLEPRIRTPRDEDGQVINMSRTATASSRSRNKMHGVKRSEKELKRSVQKLADAAGREDEMLFHLADANSDWSLSFDEFKTMINVRLPKVDPEDPEAVTRRETQLVDWYKALDANGDGTVDPYEYFMFALRECIFRAEQHREQELRAVTTGGDAIEQSAFNILLHGGLEQREGKQYVSRRTFKKLAQRLGFGTEVGEKVYENVLVEYLFFLGRRAEAIEPSKSTTAIEATYLLKAIQRQTQQLRPLLIEWMTKRPGEGRDAPTKQAIEESRSIRFSEAHLAELRDKAGRGLVHECLKQLRAILHADLELVNRLFRAWDQDKSMSIGMAEFQRGLSELGFEPPLIMVQSLFDELDDNGSNKVDFAEFKTWLAASEERFMKQLLDGENGNA